MQEGDVQPTVELWLVPGQEHSHHSLTQTNRYCHPTLSDLINSLISPPQNGKLYFTCSEEEKLRHNGYEDLPKLSPVCSAYM